MVCQLQCERTRDSGVGVRLKVGDKYWGDWRGGVWGLAPRKKNQFCGKNYAILNKFWYFFPILQQKVGGLSPPSPESGGNLSPCPPCSDAYDERKKMCFEPLSENSKSRSWRNDVWQTVPEAATGGHHPQSFWTHMPTRNDTQQPFFKLGEC